MSDNHINPYVGPRTFRKDEGHLFYGRDREARDLVSLVTSEQLVLFYAQSGAGKSSLINTRLIPSLEAKNFEVLRVGRVSGEEHEGTEVENIYVFNLLSSLMQHDVSADLLSSLRLQDFLASLKKDETGYYYDPDAAHPEEPGPRQRRALIIDQFEEIFTTHPEAWEKREDLFSQLAQTMEHDPYLWVVLVMREDYIAYLDPYAHLLPNGLRVRYYMQRLSRQAAIKAMRNPVEKIRPYASGVAEKLVENLASIKVQKMGGSQDERPGQYVEPVQLQVVCYSLWEHLPAQGVQITERDLLEVGDVDQSLERYYEGRVSAVAKQNNISQRAIREWFEEELITSAGTRNLVLQNRVGGDLSDAVIQTLQGDLVRAEMRAGQVWYELSHDRLIEPVKKNNKEWFEKNLSLFERQASLWSQQGRSDGLLLRGHELEQAELEAATKPITPEEEDFLAACRRAREREQREKRLNLFVRLLAVAAMIALVAAVALAVSAQNAAVAAEAARQNAEAARETAEAAVATATHSLGEANQANQSAASARGIVEADRLAGQAQIALGKRDTLSLGQLLAVEAYQLNLQSGEILPSVYQALFDSAESGQDTTLQETTAYHIHFGADDDQRWLLLDNTLWDLAASQRILLLDTDQILWSGIRPDGTIVIATGETGFSSEGVNVYLKDTANRTKDQFPLIGSESGDITDVRFSQDGGWIATSYYTYAGNLAHGGVQLWNTTNANLVDYFPFQSDVQGLAISSDGSRVAAVARTGTLPATVRLWTNQNGRLQPAPLQLPLESSFQDNTAFGQSGGILQFSPDGKWVAAVTDREILIWDGANVIARIPMKDSAEVTGLTFSPDSQSMVFATSGVEYCNNNHWISNCYRGVDLVEFPLDQQPASWSVRPILESHDSEITALAISGNGKLVAGDEVGYVRVWDLNGNLGDPYVTLAHAGRIVSIAIASDNETIVSSGERYGTRIWKLGEKQVAALTVYRTAGSMSDVLRSLDGDSLILSGDFRKLGDSYTAVRVISNLDDPASVTELPLRSRLGSIKAITLSDSWAAAGRTPRYDEELYFLDFWMLGTSSVNSFTVPVPAAIRSLAFNPSGTSIAAATLRNDVWVEDLDSLKNRARAERPDDDYYYGDRPRAFKTVLPNGLTDIQSLLFANDDQYLIGASADGVHLWSLGTLEEFEVTNAIYPMLMSPDQEWLITASSDNVLNLFRMESILNNTPIVVNTQATVTQLALSDSGNWLAVATGSGRLLVYEFPPADGAEPVYSLQGPTAITGINFSPRWPDEKWLIVRSGADAYLWNLKEAGGDSQTTSDNPIVLQGHRGNLLYAGFNSDGTAVITASADQTVRIWSMDQQNLAQAACESAGRNFSMTEWRTYFSGEPRVTCAGFDTVAAVEHSTPSPAATLAAGSYVELFSTPTPTSPPELYFITYTVKEGDTLSLIAVLFDTTVETIMADNGITDPRFLSVGQTLKIRTTNTPVPP